MVKFVIISPVRNEEKYIKHTLESVVNQSIIPAQWILVNDGSTDNTEHIIDQYTTKYNWIHKVNLEDRGFYYPGTGVVKTFYSGYEMITIPDWDYLVKLDCDLKFDSDYFEKLLGRFEGDSKLGIASGCTYSDLNNPEKRDQTQEDHPMGASKIYRRACWEDIGGMLPVPGWDLADLLGAQMHGWSTVCFYDLKLIHYRPSGARRKGVVRPKFLQGRFAYKHGYAFYYLFLREISHIHRRPFFIGSMAQIAGYLYGAIKGEDYLFPEDIRHYLRKRHRLYLKESFRLK